MSEHIIFSRLCVRWTGAAEQEKMAATEVEPESDYQAHLQAIAYLPVHSYLGVIRRDGEFLRRHDQLYGSRECEPSAGRRILAQGEQQAGAEARVTHHTARSLGNRAQR